MNSCWVSESAFHQILNAVSDSVKKKFDGETIFHWKRMKIMFLQVKGLIKVIVKFRVEKILYALKSNILLMGMKYCVWKRLCSNTLKRTKLKVYISLKGNKLACFANSYGSFQVQCMVHNFWKKVSQKGLVSLLCTRESKCPNNTHTQELHQNL